MRKENLNNLKIMNGDVNLDEISEYSNFLSKIRTESGENEFLIEM